MKVFVVKVLDPYDIIDTKIFSSIIKAKNFIFKNEQKYKEQYCLREIEMNINEYEVQ